MMTLSERAILVLAVNMGVVRQTTPLAVFDAPGLPFFGPFDFGPHDIADRKICLSRNRRRNPIFAPNVSRAGKQTVTRLMKDTSGHEARELRTCTQYNAQLAFWDTVT
jgi:hypothetical protein